MPSPLACLAVILLGGSVVSAQDASSPDAEPVESPGRFRLGPFYLTPTLNIGPLGLDTNVFYTATDRRTDATASGGPGLKVTLPVAPILRLFVGGDGGYVYFARTTSQRKFTGDGYGGLEILGAQIRIRAQETYGKSFQRPSYEVDQRIEQTQRTTDAEVKVRTGGRLTLRGQLLEQETDVHAGQIFLGTDLGQTLTREEVLGTFEVQIAVTRKTRLLWAADYETDRFAEAAPRNADSNRLYAGLQVESQTRFSGRAVGGVRLFRPTAGPPSNHKQAPYADVDLNYAFGPRTRLNGSYTRDLNFSAFQTSGPTPTLSVEAYGARLEQALVGRVDVHIYGRITHFLTDGAITVAGGPGQRLVLVRDDTAREAGVDLGYKFRSRLRIGVALTYLNRRSTIADFGIHGLLLGGTVTLDPKRP